MALDAHIVSHTHWDREWYHPLERFRQRLVALVDELLEDPPRADESFLLDGQAIIIDDYLAVRPERVAELGALLRSRRLEAGPWYVLADELIPSGEALVRNLFAGRRVLRRYSAEAPDVLYCPDSFGHPAALPSIAAGFGLPVIILWRGYGGARWPSGDTARWIAPSGESAVLFHLTRDGYEFGSHLPTDPAAAAERWQRMRDELVPRSTTGVLLIPNGADHHARQLEFRGALSAIETAGRDDGAHTSSLREFSEQLLARAVITELPVVRGELRDSYGYTWTLQGTFATRAHEKRLNARAERLLVREAEPWSAFASRLGAQRRSLVDVAWRRLLAAHPHDTLCGCSVDDVAAAMERRLMAATVEGRGIRDDSIADLLAHDSAAAREARDRWTPIVVIRNPAPRRRSGVAIIDVHEWIAHVPVGPGSGSGAVHPTSAVARAPRVPGLGRLQVLSKRDEYSLTESPRHYPDNDRVSVTQVAAWVEDAVPYGLVSHAIGSGRRAPGSVAHPVVVDARGLTNRRVSAVVSEDGRIALTDHASGRTIDSLLELVDETDEGDLYTPSPRPRNVSVEYRGVRRVHRGPLRGELSLRYRVHLAGARRHRVADVSVSLVLDADARCLRINVLGENAGHDHRLRLALHTDISAADVWADAAFGAVRRRPIVATPAEIAVELPPPTAPLHRYVSLFGAASGATVISDGLAEYEARDDGTVLVTLVRSVGQLSRNDLPERPGHAGWPRPTPAAQCLGPFGGKFAVMLHGERSPATIDAIERAADDVLCPLAGFTLRSALAVPAPFVGGELVGMGLAVSTIKESEDGDWLVLRCVNLTDEPVAGEWRLAMDIKGAHLARLDETIIGELVTQGSVVSFVAAPRAIVTILVR